MYERFTDRARTVMKLANQEAQRFQQHYIGTEHLLLGIIKEGSGVAVAALKNLGVEPERITIEIDRLFQKDPPGNPVDKLPTTPRAKNVIDYAMAAARVLNHDYIGTEHLLLGLLREDEGVAAQVLMKFGLRLDTVREEIRAILGRSSESEGSDEYSPQSRIHWAKDRPKSSDKSPEACPKCGDTHIVRILWNRVYLSAEDEVDANAGGAILCYYSRIRKKPMWACLRCSPTWSDVHALAMQVREWQVAKETALASQDFETAIKHRDAQLSLRQRLSQIVEELLKDQ
jgi:hypothetical protein